MIIADQVLSTEPESFVIEITEGFEQDLNRLSSLEQKQVNSKLKRITTALEDGNVAYFFKHLHKLHSSLTQYTSSLYVLTVNRELRLFLFYEDDPIFNRKIMTLLRVCHHDDMDRVSKGVAESFYQQQLNEIGKTENEG